MKMKKTGVNILVVVFGPILMFLLFSTCRNPFNKELLLHVKDSIAPEITVICPTDGSCYSSAVLVTGTVADSTQTENDHQGLVASLSYEVLASPIQGKVAVVNGEFSFMFSTESLSGNITLLLTATDWNQNQNSKYLSLLAGGSDIPSFSTTAGNREITLDWDPIPGAEEYTLYYTRDGSYPNPPEGTNGFSLSGVQPGVVLSTCPNGELHVFRLRAQFPLETGMQDSWSDFVKALPLSRLTLAPKASKDKSGKIDLWWYDVPADTGYILYRADNKAGPYYQLADRLQEARYTDRSVSEGVTYFYKVKSEHNSAVGSYPMPGKSATLDFSARISGIEVGSAPGAIALGGNFAYVGTYEHGFSAVDKSTPWPPSLVGHADWSGCEYGTIPMSTGGIALSPDGKYAYVAAHARRLYVIGLNTATTPIDDRLKAVHEFTQGSDGSGTDGKDVAVAGGHVFATNYDFLYVYDAADSRDITYESRFDLRTYIDYAWRLSVQYLSDTVWRAYICGMYTGKRGLVIVDINVSANPATFTPRSTYSMDTAANQVQILGHYAYIASGQGIQVVDVSDPANPSLSCTFESSDSVSDLSIAGDFLYAMVMNKGLYRYRIVDPANPGGMILERVYDEVIDGHFVVAENYAYVANPFEGQGGLSIVYIGDEFFDFTDRAVLDFAGYGAYQNLSDFDVCDDVVFAAIRTGGLARARGVPPATFQPLGSYTPESLGAAAGVKVIGDLAFLADSNFGLRVIDVSNPVLEELEEIGSLKATFRERDSWMNYCQIGLEVVGDYVFLPDFDGGILVVDASDPNDLVKVAVIPMLANTFEVVAQEKTLYAAGHTSGLHAIDIADPENPHKLSTYFQGGSAMGLDVEDQIVYLAAFDRSVDIIDYANPAQPLLLGRYDWPDPLSWGWIVCAMDVDVVGSYAFVSRFEGGVMSLDISDPQHPYYQGGSESIGGFYQRDTSTVYVYSGYIYAGGIRSDDYQPALMTYRIQTQQ